MNPLLSRLGIVYLIVAAAPAFAQGETPPETTTATAAEVPSPESSETAPADEPKVEAPPEATQPVEPAQQPPQSEPAPNPASGGEPETLIVVGSRTSKARTAVESPVAIDVISTQEVATESGHLDLNRLLHAMAPSFNATRQSGADGADHIDPATLRGLGPDQTLVLINGKRRHQSSLINIFGSRGRGNTGTDLNAIPLAAIDRIEILRDGASALYGSDAIAGVINIVLKKDTGVFDAWLSGGMRNAKPPSEYNVLRSEALDGESVAASANYGLRLGDRGFANFTLDYNKLSHTNRPANPENLAAYRRQFGDAAVDNFGFWGNAELGIENNTDGLIQNLRFYAFGGSNYRDTNAYAWTREFDSDRNVQAIYPNGFDPRITSRITDLSLSAGVKADAGEWAIDLNNTFGRNRFHYLIEDTLNASLLENSPTRFDAGGHQFSQNVTGLTFSRAFTPGETELYFVLGGEFRLDNYLIFAGEEGSYRNYGLEERVVDGEVMQVDTLMRPGGSQGFPGYRPDNEVDESRTNLAVYSELSLEPVRPLLLEAAARVEQYSDFGTTFNAKGAARLELAGVIGADALDHLALRASVSSGFRAPSLAQIYYNTTFTDFVGGVPIDKLIAKNNSPVTRTLGIPQLKEETSISGSAGVTAQLQWLSLSLDGYYVEIKDRIVLTGAFDAEDPDIGAELMALNVGAAQFFANALDTKTLGLDAVIDGRWTLGAHRVRAQLSANFNRMTLGDLVVGPRLTGKEDTFFGEREKKFLLASAPKSKVTLLLGETWGPLFANVIFTRYDKVDLIDWLDTIDLYEPKITTDLNIGWNAREDLTLIVGGMNIFNVYPSQQDTETETGGIWDAVQMGYGGAFYYAKVNLRL